jgi:hypothetical protein
MSTTNGMTTIMSRRNRRVGAVAALALVAMTASACDSGLTEVNENPNAPENVPVNNLLLGGIRDVIQNGGERGAFGKWMMLYHSGNWAQHVAQPVYNDEDQYTPRAGIPDLIWDEMYFALTDLAEVKRMSDATDDNIWAIAEIMTVYGFMILTDQFDAIPYTEALRLSEGISAPAYDDQSAIYPDLIARLAAAAARIDNAAIITFADYDPVYQGDMDGWEMFANSLRLRLAMRMVNSSPAAAQAAFEAAWASTIFAANADEATMDWQPDYPAANPTYEGIIYAGRTGDFRMSESLIDRMAAFNDPRLPIYADPAESDGQYRGLRNGLVPGDYVPAAAASDFSWIGAYFLDASTPSPLMSYSEVLFLGAEAAELGWNTGGQTATALYDAGITASMAALGVSGADIATYLAQASVDYATGTYAGLDAIHVQKWIALFQSGPEAYSDLRRIGFDWTTDAATTGTDLIPAENSVIGPVFPGRLPYPEDEGLFNPDNFPGVQPITASVWWM